MSGIGGVEANFRATRAREGVVAVIQDADGRYLLIQRAEGILAGGWWCFPGGAIEHGETQEEAIVREVWEEIGIDVSPIRRIWEWSHPDGSLRLHWWVAERITIGLVLDPREVQAVSWRFAEDIVNLDKVLPSNLEFLAHLH